jgi:small-conductance mechanosensitive channel
LIFEDFLNFLISVHPEAPRFLGGIIVLAFFGIFYRFLSRWVTNASERFEIDEHTENSLRLILRVLIIVLTIIILFSIFDLPTEWFVGASALVGAAIGFGSSQTINNIVAGFYVILTSPFKVEDYVFIGEFEGQVEEISINYTKLYTPSFNLLLIPNIQVMNNRVLNCTHEGFIKYTFSLNFPHSVEITIEEIINECIEPSIEEFYHEHRDIQLRKPEYYFEKSTNFARSFKFRIFIPKEEAKDLYILQPELAKKIVNKWDLKRFKR